MNVSASQRPLIIGIGNPLRSDDGLGWAVVEELAHDEDLDCDLHTAYQLTPELAQPISTASIVIMIDAQHAEVPGELCIKTLEPYTRPGAIGSHHTTPEELAVMARAIYGYCPPIVLITMTANNFELGEHLSPPIQKRLHILCAAVRELCITQELPRPPSSPTIDASPRHPS